MFALDSSLEMAQSILEKKKSSKKSKARTNRKSSNVSVASSAKATDKKKNKNNKALDLDASVPSLTSPSNADEVSVMSDEASTATTALLSPSSSHSAHSTRSSSSCRISNRARSTSGESFLFQHSMAVDRTWELLRTTVPEYETQLGEQIVLHMMELDATARQSMGITSLRSSRFDEISNFLVVMVDMSVSLIGPSDLEEFQEELREMGQQCLQQGIRVSLLGEAVARAVKQTLSTTSTTTASSGDQNPAEDASVGGDYSLLFLNQQHTFSQKDEESWKIVIDHVAQSMAPSSS